LIRSSPHIEKRIVYLKTITIPELPEPIGEVKAKYRDTYIEDLMEKGSPLEAALEAEYNEMGQFVKGLIK